MHRHSTVLMYITQVCISLLISVFEKNKNNVAITLKFVQFFKKQIAQLQKEIVMIYP